jgi:hypothetical protein
LKEKYKGLAAAERLAIVNTVPRNLCVLSLLVEEAGERFSEDEMESILKDVEDCIPEIEKKEEDEDE